jgi:hypothetical protein
MTGEAACSAPYAPIAAATSFLHDTFGRHGKVPARSADPVIDDHAASPMTDGDHRVLKFRPRTADRPPAADRGQAGQPVKRAPDLSSYQQAGESADDYRHRMIANTAAIVFTAALTGAGIWLAVTLADLRNTQDCVLMGRRDCGHISAQSADPTRHN